MNRDRLFLVFSIFALCFLAFISGGTLTYFKKFPYAWIQDATEAKNALQTQKKLEQTSSRKHKESRNLHVITRLNKPEAFQSYNLLVGPTFNKVVMQNMQNSPIYQWKFKLKAGDILRDIHLYPNGDVLATAENPTTTPYGRGLIKLDKNSNKIWEYHKAAHHKVSVDTNGLIYGAYHQFNNNPEIIKSLNTRTKYLEDYLYILDDKGVEKQSFSLLQALLQSPFSNLLQDMNLPAGLKWDPLHTNSVMVLDPEMAKAFPMFKPGQVLVSMRHQSIIGVVDTEKRQFVWAQKGPWQWQHDAKFTSNGEIMLYDNLGNPKNSRIMAINPATNKKRIVFKKTDKISFKANLLGEQTMLPNGHLNIIDPETKRVIELDPVTGEVFWLIKINNEGPLNAMRRYPPSYVNFLNNP